MNRRLGPALLVGAGVFCLVLSLLVLTVAKPRLLKAPTSNAVTTESLGTARVLDGTTQSYSEQTLRLDRILRNVTKGTSDTAVYAEQLRLYPVDSSGKVLLKGGSTADTPFVDGKFVGAKLDNNVVAFDRSTGKGKPGFDGDTYNTTAYTVKLPFGTEKQMNGKPATYDFFDQTSGQAFPITYSGTEKVDGLEVYRFEDTIAPIVIDQQFGELAGTKTGYSNKGRTVLVEPVTGSIVSIVTSPTSSIVNADGSQTVALEVTKPLTPTADTVAALVSDAKDSKSKAHLISFTLPLVLGVLGLLLLVAGLLLPQRRPREDDRDLATAGRNGDPDYVYTDEVYTDEPVRAVDLDKTRQTSVQDLTDPESGPDVTSRRGY